MNKLTSKQANNLANNFLALAEAIGTYRYTHYLSLNKVQNQKLRESHQVALHYSDNLYTISTTLILEDITYSLLQVELITKKIEKSYQSLKDIQKAIDIANQVATLGASIISLNSKAFIDSLSNLKNMTQE